MSKPMSSCSIEPGRMMTAKPTRNIDSVSWTEALTVPRSRMMPGKAGRYMSVDSGPSAVRQASRIVSNHVSGLSMRNIPEAIGASGRRWPRKTMAGGGQP